MTSPDQDFKFDTLLDYLWQKHHFDFTAYKRNFLMRRIQHRMQQIFIECYSEYNDYLEAHSKEFVHLFNTIENNTTSFFRDQAEWDIVSNQIVPRIIASKLPDEPIRVWSAGCASGQEIYTLAIVLAEALGLKQFCQRVRIYATDIDKEALSQARLGTYLRDQITDIPDSLLTQYFELANDCYIFRSNLRHQIVFHHHNMIEDAPISKIDLLVCRNTMIYFNLEAQTKVLVRFHFSLKDSGFLFLGRCEMAPNPDLFTNLNLPKRIFAKVPQGHLNQRLLVKAFRRHSSSKLAPTKQ